MSGLWVQFPVGAHVRGLSHGCFSPSLSPSLPLSLKSMNVSSGGDLKKIFLSKEKKYIY